MNTSRSPRRSTLRIGAVALAVTAFGVPFSGPLSDCRAAPLAGAGGRTDDRTPASDDGGECATTLAKLRKAYGDLPKVMFGLSTERADQLARDVERSTLDADRYLSKCSGAAEAPEVHFLKSKFLHLLSTRVRYQTMAKLPQVDGRVEVGALEKALQPFHRTVQHHADAACRGLASTSPMRAEALELRAWAHMSLEEWEAARSDYNEYLGAYPKSDRKADITSALGRVYLELEAYDKGVEIVEAALSDPVVLDSPSFPHLGDLLWKLNEAKGDFDGMAKAADRVLELFPFRMKSTSIEPRTRELYDRTIDVSGFRRAYVRFARGEFQRAEEHFRKHVAAIDRKETELRTAKEELKPVSSIYRERSRTCADFIEKFAGKAAPADFDLDDKWITEKQTKLADSRGKVVALVFRGVGDARSKQFLEAIDKVCADDEKLELVTISYLHSTKNVAEQMNAMRSELLEVSYQNAAGFDPDLAGKSLFKLYGAYVGSATFMIFDRQGQPVWFQQDPRTIDINFARSILIRLRDGK